MRLCKIAAVLIAFLFASPAWALTCPPLPWVFINGLTNIISAPQVNANFSTLWNCFLPALTGYTGATSGGAPNTQEITYTSGPSTYSTGTIYSFIVGSGLTNTGAATVNINSLGAKSVEIDGAPLVGGEMVAGTSVSLMYDGAALQLLASPGARSPAPNILYNGAMEIDQANEGASVSIPSGTDTYVVDGWEGSLHSASAAVSCQRVADAPPGFTDSLECTTGTGAAVGAGDYLVVKQKVEADNITGAGFGTSAPANLCLSFWVKGSIGSYTMAAAIRNAALSRTFVEPLTIATGATWTPESMCFSADTAGTWVTSGSAEGLEILLVAAAGGNFQGAAGSWQNNNFVATTAITNTLLSTTGATFQVTGAKLEISPVPTPYVRLPMALELARSERYYEKSYDLGVALGSTGNGEIKGAGAESIASSNYLLLWAPFRQTMRCEPTVTLYSDLTGVAGKIDVNGTDYSAAATSSVFMNGFNGVQNLSGSTWTAPFSYAFNFVADCRL